MQQTVLVTGASRGIGLATVEALLSSGQCGLVVGVARTAAADAPEVQRVCAAHAGRFRYVSGDLAQAATQTAAVAAAGGALDAVVFNAARVDPIARLAAVGAADVSRLLDVNVVAILALAQKALPLLKKAPQGRMLFVSSGAAAGPYAGWGPYCMSKAALNMLSSVFALEEPTLVSFAFRPGVVETEMQATIRNERNVHEMGAEKHEQFKKLYENGDLLKPHVPGGILAKMSLTAGLEFSGQFLSWNDEKLAAFRE